MIFLPLLILMFSGAQAEDVVLQDGEIMNNVVLPVRIFEPYSISNVQSARIFARNVRGSDINDVEEIEICYISKKDSLHKLLFILSHMSGYRIPNKSYQGEWRRSLKLNDGRIVFISNDIAERYSYVVIKFEGNEFVVSPNNESRVHGFFDCLNNF